MGTKTPVPCPDEWCELCDDVLWPAGETPRFIHLTATGLVKCPGADYDPPNGVYVLEQGTGYPCIWEYQDDIHFWRVVIAAGGYVWGTQKRDAGATNESFRGDLLGCVSDSDNLNVSCEPFVACKDGSVSIVWS